MSRKLTKITAIILAVPDLASYCPDLASWAASWCGDERDIIPGEAIVAVFTPFLQDLLDHGLSRKTLNLHRDNLWLLGGEIIRDINETPKLRKRPAAELIRDAISCDEGPLIRGCVNDIEQHLFDSTCRKLKRFMAAAQTNSQQR
jgi:hypothetical protein